MEKRVYVVMNEDLGCDFVWVYQSSYDAVKTLAEWMASESNIHLTKDEMTEILEKAKKGEALPYYDKDTTWLLMTSYIQ